MSNTTATVASSFPFFQILTVLFIYLKLTHTIAWTWWAVFAPLWVPVCVILAVCAVLFAGYLVLHLIGVID